MAYAFQKDENKEQLAYSRVEGVNASYRDLCNVCSNIRGRRADKAIEYLEEALEKKRPIRYFRHNKRRGHLHELGGKKGGYPVKSVNIVLGVLKNAVANADSKGLGDCKIVHACANKQLIYSRMSPKGRRIRHNFETAFVEIVVRELQTADNLKKKEQKQKALEEAKRKELEAKKLADAKKEAEAKKQAEAKKDEVPKEGAKKAADAKVVAESKQEEKPVQKSEGSKKGEPEPAHKKMSDVLSEQKKSASASAGSHKEKV